jgi:hypothetical protein
MRLGDTERLHTSQESCTVTLRMLLCMKMVTIGHPLGGWRGHLRASVPPLPPEVT